MVLIMYKPIVEFLLCFLDLLIFYIFSNNHLIQKKKRFWLIKTLFLSFFSYLLTIATSFSFIAAIMNGVVLILYLDIIFVGTIKRKFFLGMIFYVSLGLYTMFFAQVWEFLTDSIILTLDSTSYYTSRVLFSLISKLILGFGLMFYCKNNKCVNLSLISTKPVIILLCASFIILSLSFSMEVLNFVNESILILLTFFLLFIVIVSIWIIKLLYQVKNENLMLEIETRNINNAYIQVKKDQDQIIKMNKMKHDMNNMLIVAKRLCDNQSYDELSSYLSSIICETTFEKRVSSGDSTIDAIVNAKITSSKSVQFITKFEVEGPSFNKLDIAVLLGNALDNAIEATLKCENMHIELYIKETSNIFLMYIKNTYDGELFFEKEKLLSTKRNYVSHGLGMDSMQEIVKKYNGKMIYKNHGKYFELDIVITR